MALEMSISTLYTMMKQEMDKQAALIKDNTEKIMMTIDDKIKPLIQENNNLKLEIKVLNMKINALENATKKNNIIIHGFKETETNYTELFNSITELLGKLGIKIDNHDINKLHRIGKRTDGKTRPILISLTTYNKKIEILRNKKKMLEPTYITEDFSKETLQKRKELQEELHREREKGNNVYIKNNKVVTKPKGNEKRKRETSISPATQNQHVLGDNNKNILAPAKLHRTDPFAYMRSRSHSLTETTTPKA
ncbi:unnamed protein product [Euphydryas editha]|uniref:Endonuclease-reverse transcriptase n=1 Tax=Euphydryas editha TaxID=104508 RepID=A0AAU9TKL9_EUPED|nr:unnamed protein product [Euphydryas editha]